MQGNLVCCTLHPGHLSRLMLTKRRQYPEMMAYQHPRSLRPQKKAGPLRLFPIAYGA
jgi:hypothetical protein